VARAGLPQMGGQVLDTARVDRLGGAVRPLLGDPAGGTRRRLQIAVQVVEGEELDVLVAARGAVAQVALATQVTRAGLRLGGQSDGQRRGGGQ
jgi:hypothetical protein